MRVYALALMAGLASTSAYAADVVMEEPPAPVAVVQEVPIFGWAGGYVGLQGGGLWSDGSFDEFDRTRHRRVLGQLQRRPLRRLCRLQLAVRRMGVRCGRRHQRGLERRDLQHPSGLGVNVGTDYLASLRGRAGYAFDRTLIFATGGVAFTQFSAEANLGNGVSLNADQSLTGWTIGAGAEYAFTNNWIGRLEYRYYDFSDDVIDNFGDVKLETNTLTVGAAYKF